MAKYRKKPVVIEAMRYTGTPDTCVAIHEWCGYQHNPEAGCDSGIYIDTLEGQMRADVGDWIIKGVQGEFYPCKPDIFEETYELVDEDAKWAAVSRLQAAVVAATPRGGLAMSSDYTPTTEDVREAYGWTGHDSYVEENRAAKQREFNRWLAAYTAETQAEVLEQAAVAGAGYVVTAANRRYREGAEHADIYWKLALERAAQRLREQATNQQDRRQ